MSAETTLSRDLKTAYQEGSKACGDGKPRGACPYGNLLWSERSQSLLKEWMKGYDAAEIAMRTARRRRGLA